jgi:hypothetical protein
LPGGGGLTAPHTRSNRPLWTADFRVVSAIVGAWVLRLLVVFVPRTSNTLVATWFWQTEGRSAEFVILGVRPSEFIFLEFQISFEKNFYRLPFTPHLSSRLIGPSKMEDSNAMTTPMSTTTALHGDEEGEHVDQKENRSMIGSLLYLTATRPDIQFSVCLCARF